MYVVVRDWHILMWVVDRLVWEFAGRLGFLIGYFKQGACFKEGRLPSDPLSTWYCWG